MNYSWPWKQQLLHRLWLIIIEIMWINDPISTVTSVILTFILLPICQHSFPFPVTTLNIHCFTWDPPTQTTIPEFATQNFFLVLEGNGQILHDHSPLSAFLLHTLPTLSPQLLLALQISEGELLKGESPCVLWISFFPVMILGLHLLFTLFLLVFILSSVLTTFPDDQPCSSFLS